MLETRTSILFERVCRSVFRLPDVIVFREEVALGIENKQEERSLTVARARDTWYISRGKKKTLLIGIAAKNNLSGHFTVSVLEMG